MSWLQEAIRWVLPQEDHFFDYVLDAANAAVEAGRLFEEVAGSTNHAARVALVERIRDAEHNGDRALQAMSDALDKTFVTPMDREDLFRLTSTLESVSDFISATANHLTVHRMEQLPLGTEELARVISKATTLLRDAVSKLKQKGSLEAIRANCRDIHYLEHEADVIFRTRIGDLFGTEKDAIALIKQKEFLEGMEDSVDRCAVAARVLEGVLLKNA